VLAPTDPPIPIPPIDQGCFPINLDGRLYVPGQSSAVPDGLQVTTTLVNDDPCDPEIDIALRIPCFVDFSAGTGTITYDVSASAPLIEFAITGGTECDFSLDLSLTLPCPTGLTGGIGTVEYAAPGLPGSTAVVATAAAGTCDFDLTLNALLPCPGNFKAGINVTNAACLPRPPTIGVRVGNILDSSSAPTCGFNLDFDLDMPCPVVWQGGEVVTRQINAVGLPTGNIFINMVGLSSSLPCDNSACEPFITLDLEMPCPVDFAAMEGAVDFYGYDSVLAVAAPWATEPDGRFVVTFIDGDVCSPFLDLSLNLPCPIEVDVDADGTVNTKDSLFYATTNPSREPPVRDWAHGAPQGRLTLNLGTVDGDPTHCLPSLDVSLNMPCPGGGIHRGVQSPEELSILLWRQNQPPYLTDPDHPYRNFVPGTIQGGETQFLLHARDPVTYPALLAQSARGQFVKMEFDSDCQLDLNLSLHIPCVYRDINLTLRDFDTGSELTSADGYSVVVTQDWAIGGSNPCAFVDDVDVYLTQGGGAGSTARFAKITSSFGAISPFFYSATEQQATAIDVWVDKPGGMTWSGTLRNIAEIGPAGTGAAEIPDDSIIIVWETAVGSDIWVFDRLHYRGVYG
jgi:hypothetical protein